MERTRVSPRRSSGPTADRLAGRYRVHVVTLRGFGRTDPQANAQGALSAVSAGTVTGRIDYLAGQLSTATGALESAAPSISKLAGKVVTRTI